MIYRGQAFSLSYDLAPPPQPPPSPVSKMSFFISLPVCRWSSLLVGMEGGEGGGGAKSYDGEQALSSINHSILSGRRRWRTGMQFINN
jgi:hypothetical protein